MTSQGDSRNTWQVEVAGILITSIYEYIIITEILLAKQQMHVRQDAYITDQYHDTRRLLGLLFVCHLQITNCVWYVLCTYRRSMTLFFFWNGPLLIKRPYMHVVCMMCCVQILMTLCQT